MKSFITWKILGNTLHPVNLKFKSHKLEKEFSLHYPEKYIGQLRLAHILAVVFFCFAVVIDTHILSKKSSVAVIILLIVLPVFITGFILSFKRKKFYLEHYQWINLIYVLLTGLSFIYQGFYAKYPEKYFVYSGIIICLIFNYTFIKQDFIKASVAGFILLVFYFLSYESSMGQKGFYNHISAYILVSNFLGMFIAYSIEYDGRRSFILGRKVASDRRKILKHNELLAKKIEERTHKLSVSNEELLLAKEKAEESDRLKSAFLANMSHEIRTPMNAILGYSELINKDLDDEKFERYKQFIDKSGIRLIKTIEDLIIYSRLEAGQINVRPTRCKLSSLLDEVFVKNETDHRLKENKTSFKKEINESTLHTYVKTDPTFFYLIMNNLIDNAIKFTTQGEVILGTEALKKNQNFVRIFVKDTGKGISDDNHKAIFNPFHRLEDDLFLEGTGLGLSIVKDLLKKLKGKIELESAPGKGSIFRLLLPKSS